MKVMSSFVKCLPDNFVVFPPVKNALHMPVKQSSGDFISPASLGDSDVTFEQMQEIYKLGEESFGSAFVVQVPGVYLCLSHDHIPSFLNSSVYRDQASTGDALLNPPATKKARSRNCHSTNKPKPRRSQPLLPSQVFEGYKSLSDKHLNIPMSIRSCWEKSVDSLKRKSNSLPMVVPHPHRALLAHYSSRITGCMPHNTFTRPLHPPLRPGYSLQYLIL